MTGTPISLLTFCVTCWFTFISCSVGSATASPIGDSDWPGWRGPRGDGVARESTAPDRWSETAGIRWKAPLTGEGVGQPVVCGDLIFLTSSDGSRHDQLHFFCLDRRDGHELWHRNFWGTAPTLRHEPKSSMATPTPITDGKRVWAFFGTGDLICLDLDGNMVWCRSLAQEYEPFQNRFAMGSSPVLADNVLVLQCDHWGQSYLLGVDKRTGKNVWKTDRSEHVSWSSPLVVDIDDFHQELVVCATFQVKGYDARWGQELWHADGMTRECIPTAVSSDGLIFAVSGQKGETLAIRSGGRGDITDTHIVWRSLRSAPFVPSGLVLDGLYYLVDDSGIAACFEASTGKLVWQQRLGGAFTASPVAAAGKIYFTAEDGTTTVVRAGRNFEVIAKNQIHESVFASPAIAHDELFIRSDRHLFCCADAPYFPIRKSKDDAGISEFEAEWYSKALRRMHEPQLLESARDASIVAYRFTILPTWGNPIAVRAEKKEGVFRLDSCRLDGQGGYDPGKIAEQKQVKLSESDSQALDSLIAALKYFQMSFDDDAGAFDGEQWILEGVANGKYHIVQRWCADYQAKERGLEPFLALCKFLIDKSTLSERPKNGRRELLPVK